MVCASAVTAVNAVFIHHTGCGVFDMAFPEVSVVDLMHFRFLPVVAFADQGNSGRARSKRPEGDASWGQMCAKKLISVK